jgi:hypothetical protein
MVEGRNACRPLRHALLSCMGTLWWVQTRSKRKQGQQWGAAATCSSAAAAAAEAQGQDRRGTRHGATMPQYQCMMANAFCYHHTQTVRPRAACAVWRAVTSTCCCIRFAQEKERRG